ncbi:MAG: FHA domain-containing protein [Anaerolineae bacterium]|nr:FHA domain-containing protein [Anaerolineae bacterium]
MDGKRFSRFEERIQALVEGSFARLFAGQLQPREVALQLARAMEDEARQNADGFLAAPNVYTVHIHPHDKLALLVETPDLAEQMAEHVLILVRESGLFLDDVPQVTLVGDDAVSPHSVLVMAEHVEHPRQSTQMMTPQNADSAPALPPAFLVVDGERYVPLDRPVINIGRRRDNTLVIDDPRVSRQHCQLRLRFGHFVLYDLGSRGGTSVNDARVTECVLRSGDVIALAGVQVVYMLEEGSTGRSAASGDTQVRMPRDLSRRSDLRRDDPEGNGER